MTTGLNFTIPLPQLVCAILIIAACLFMGRYKTGLLVGYFACLYWGYIANMSVLIGAFGGSIIGLIAFVSLGLGLALLGLYMFFVPTR